MNEQKKRQLIKALAYNTDREQIKSVMGVSDDELTVLPMTKLRKRKNITKKWGILNEQICNCC